jgi:DNA adenine methylase
MIKYSMKHSTILVKKKLKVSPFVKWAGGKAALLPTILQNLPNELFEGKISKYAEPFVGGGAVLFQIATMFNFDRILISDINQHLICAYKVIKTNVNELIAELEDLKDKYISLDTKSRETFYYKIRESFNQRKNCNVRQAAYFIFLNKTCFNGLYRENRSGQFNVPFGRHKNPSIFNPENLKNISRLLNSTEFFIKSVDFEKTKRFIDKNTFVYMDPPYRPVSATANFTSYNKSSFGDNEQVRLAQFFQKLHKKGAKLMLSNSFSEDGFFNGLYKDFNIKIVETRRSVSGKSSGRGRVKEILVMNYEAQHG